MTDIRHYLNEKGYSFIEKERHDGVNAIMVCPFCHGGRRVEKTFAIHLETGAWNCLRKIHCGLSGSFRQFQERLGDKPEYKPFYKKDYKKTYSLPKVSPRELSLKAMNYLHERGFTDEIIEKFKLFEGSKGEICFPYFKNNKQVNVKHRTIEKKFWQEDNAEPCLFNRDLVDGDYLIITEGEFDCMALVQYDFANITSLPSGVADHRWIENEWEFLEQFKTIFLCMDNDKAGQDVIQILISRLGRWRCNSVIFPRKDANDCLVSGISYETIAECFRNATEFPPALLKKSGNYREEVFELFTDEAKFNGTDTGFPGLNCYLKGWRKGEVTIWSGNNGSGKSTILNQVCLFLASQKIRSCIASLELRPARYLKWMASQAVGKEKLTFIDIDKAFNWFDQWVWILDTVKDISPKEILEPFEYAVKKYGVEHFIIDSLMRVNLPNGNDKYDAQGDFVSRLSDFAKEYYCHIHLVAHPRKGQSDNKTPDKVDVAGTGDITNLADNVLILWRPDDEKKEADEPDAVIYVKKNREMGNIGGVKLYFDKKSKRFRCGGQVVNFYLGEK